MRTNREFEGKNWIELGSRSLSEDKHSGTSWGTDFGHGLQNIQEIWHEDISSLHSYQSTFQGGIPHFLKFPS